MKDRILNWLDAQLGLLLLAAAAVCVVLSFWYNSAPVLQNDLTGANPTPPVNVLLDAEKIRAASGEVYFAADPGNQYYAKTGAVFVPEKVEFVFHKIDLDIPSMGVMRPPQILPDPGPSLEGAHKLPRYGDEYPPLEIVVQKPGATGAAGGGATGGGGVGALSGVKGQPAPKPAPAIPTGAGATTGIKNDKPK